MAKAAFGVRQRRRFCRAAKGPSSSPEMPRARRALYRVPARLRSAVRYPAFYSRPAGKVCPDARGLAKLKRSRDDAKNCFQEPIGSAPRRREGCRRGRGCNLKIRGPRLITLSGPFLTRARGFFEFEAMVIGRSEIQSRKRVGALRVCRIKFLNWWRDFD